MSRLARLLATALLAATAAFAQVGPPFQRDTRAQPAASPAPAAQPNGQPPSAADAPVAPAERPGFRLTPDGLPIYGSQLFQGDFRELSFTGFNPDYQLSLGDRVQVMIWGAMEHALEIPVDAKGNLFIPNVGPVPVLGVRNADLNRVVNEQLRRVYKDNVEAYANLRSTQTVKVFVSGHARQPGLYEGFASDSPLYFLDRAGGVDPDRGSYLRVSHLRGQETVATINLYDFLESGVLPPVQFRDGDVLLVHPRGPVVTVTGRVTTPGRFEFAGDTAPLDRLLALARPVEDATAVSVRRARGGDANSLVSPLAEAAALALAPGDTVEVTGRHVSRTVLVTYTGEHDGPAELVFPHGTLLSEAIAAIAPTPLSDSAAVQVYRRSVVERQRALLQQSLDNLERSLLNAPSSTLEQAQLRQVEAQSIFSFIERARKVEPKGQIILRDPADAERIHLEDGDVLHIPALSQLVTIHGEVKYPNTQLHRDRARLAHYIEQAGGYTEVANNREIIVVRPNGLIETISTDRYNRVGPGDEILVLPKTDPKRLLYAKEITTIIYQIALGARVVVGL